jgi:hypothetical protein
MHLVKKISLSVTLPVALLACTFLMSTAVSAAPDVKPAIKTSKNSKTYTEIEFLNAFEGKSRKYIQGILGAPVKKEQSVKPTGAEKVVAGKAGPGSESKRVNVEMWYYHNLVKYDPKRTYKETELTFVNDRCMNVAFFNNR